MAHSDRHRHAQTPATSRKVRIRALNDDLRRTLTGGRLVITPGLQQFDAPALRRLLQALVTYDGFTPDNDPHGEHDFGSVTLEGETVFWKIDYYDSDLIYGSPDPSDPSVTIRVLTLMLASEY